MTRTIATAETITAVAVPAASTAAASSLSSQSPHTWTIAEARQKYGQYKQPVNNAIRRLRANPSTTAQMRTAVRGILSAEGTFARQLARGDWPNSIAPAARKLESAVIYDRTYYGDDLLQPTVDAMKEVLAQQNATHDRAVSAAQAMSIALGD